MLGTYTRDLTPAQTGEFMRSEEKLWWPIVREVNKRPAGAGAVASLKRAAIDQPPGTKAPGGISLGST